MKNRKSVGEDGLIAEYVGLKYGPPEIHNGIAIHVTPDIDQTHAIPCTTQLID